VSRLRPWLVGFLALLALVVALVLVASGVARRRLARELESIRTSGAPAVWEDVPERATDGLDTTVWIRALEALPQPTGFSPEPFWEEILREEAAGVTRAGYRLALEEVLACLDDIAWADLIAGLESTLRLEPGCGFELTPCERAVIAAQARGWDEFRTVVSEPRRLALPAPEDDLFGAGAEADGFGASIRGCLRAVQALGTGALEHAVSGRPDRAVEAMTAALEAAAWSEGVRHPSAYDVRTLALAICLDFLQRILPRLPQGLDVAPIRAALASIDPAAELRSWVLAWRAYGNSAFRSHRESMTVGPSGLVESVRLTFDQLRFLTCCEQGLKWQRRPYREIRHEIDAWDEAASKDHPGWAMMSAMLWPDFALRFENAARQEAELLVTRAALLSHESGAERALLWAAEQVDPFDGAALRANVRDDGVLEFWSVGGNGNRKLTHPPRQT
jgi:hypothetical protein